MLATYGLLIARFCYLGCLLPQIWLTQKLKIGNALSDLFLLGYLNGYLAFIFYIFCYQLPPAYKILAPIETFATLVMVGQRLYFDKTASARLTWFYIVNVLIFLAFIPWALQAPSACGNFFGWLTFAIAAVNQLPQVIKVFYAKSVRGFSFMFVVLGGVAAIAEFSASVALSLPIQTIINAFRGILIFLVFCFQFAWYRK
ncbi:MAG: PQ-loop repeat-containing protein [Candidatus Babeliales bacterium]